MRSFVLHVETTCLQSHTETAKHNFLWKVLALIGRQPLAAWFLLRHCSDASLTASMHRFDASRTIAGKPVRSGRC